MDEQYEAFDVNEYDLESALNPLSRRRISKQQQIYGIWADEESDEDNAATSRQSRNASKNKDYTKPVAFVSSGDKAEAEEEENDQSADEEIVHAKAKVKGRYFDKRSAVEEERTFAGIRGSGKAQDIGSWEKHTKGIGAKLLEKMGYRKGEGLGKSGQGIAKPLEPVVRPGRGAIGLYGPESAEGAKPEDGAPPQKPTKQQHVAGWKRGSSSMKVKQEKVIYKTWDEVVLEGGVLKRHWSTGSVSSKIIDMTSAEQRTYESYEDFAVKTRMPRTVGSRTTRHAGFDVPELLHNISLILGMTEEAIVNVDKQLKTLQDQNVSYRYEAEVLLKNSTADEEQVKRLTLLDHLLDKFDAKIVDMSISECKDFMKNLQTDFYEEYKLYGLCRIALSHVLPILRMYFADWNPLTDPEYGLEVMLEWRALLEESSEWNGSCKIEELDVYHQLVWVAWMPAVRRAVHQWNVREPDPMLKLLKVCKPIVPAWIFENLVDRFVLPKIEKEAELWDPVTDTQPVHLWIHPWLPLVGDRLKPIYPSIRHKLAKAMTRWNPSDRSAKWMLKPWKEVFTAGSMSSFLNQHVLPKLENCLQMLVINPSNQQLGLWHDVMDWLDMIHPSTIAASLVRFFFPKWHRALCLWLTCPQPNYSEISNWYSGWKSLFSEELISFASIREQFTTGLMMMNRALSGQPPVGPALVGTPRFEFFQQPATHAMPSNAFMNVPGAAIPANFRDVVDRRAAELGIVFVPVPDRYREGKPVYQFGQRIIYIDRNVIFMQQSPSQWVPVSLEQLVSSSYS